MKKVIFSIKYEILAEKKDEYLTVVKELKQLISSPGLESYTVFEHKSKKNLFEEVYVFESEESYENFDDNPSERVEKLVNKLTDMVIPQTTVYSTLFEVL